MLYFINSFQFSISIHNNIIDTSYNIETFIKNFIENNVLYTQINGLILIKLKSFSYSYPKSLPNIIVDIDRFKIYIEGVFDCIKFVQEMIINDLVINTNNKIDNMQLFTKNVDNIIITCIDKNNGVYKCTNEFAVIKKIHFINNNINVIIEKYDNNILKELHFNTNFNIKNRFIDIINNNINKSFKYNIDGTLYDYISLIKYISLLKKKTNYTMTINLKKITIGYSPIDIIPTLLYDQYFNNLLINLFNYYTYYK
jgi:hypothetical protein